MLICNKCPQECFQTQGSSEVHPRYRKQGHVESYILELMITKQNDIQTHMYNVYDRITSPEFNQLT